MSRSCRATSSIRHRSTRLWTASTTLFLLTAFTPDQETPAANAIAAAQRAGGLHVVRMSVVGASEDSSFATGRGCARTEKQLPQSGLDWTVLQPHAFMQNVLGNAGTIATEGVLYGTTGEGRIGTVDTRDIASVARTALTEPGHTGKTYVLTGPESLSHADMAATLAAVLGKEVRYVDVPPDQYEQTLLGYGLPEPLAEDIRVLYGEIFRSGGGDFVTTHVQDVTGRPPRSFEEFVRDHADRVRRRLSSAPGRRRTSALSYSERAARSHRQPGRQRGDEAARRRRHGSARDRRCDRADRDRTGRTGDRDRGRSVRRLRSDLRLRG